MENTYYIFSMKRGACGNDALWYGPNSSGYTTHLNRAGIYSEEEANRIVDACTSGEIAAIPVEQAELESHRAVDFCKLRNTLPPVSHVPKPKTQRDYDEEWLVYMGWTVEEDFFFKDPKTSNEHEFDEALHIERSRRGNT